jgi:hypothetical protein
MTSRIEPDDAEVFSSWLAVALADAGLLRRSRNDGGPSAWQRADGVSARRYLR